METISSEDDVVEVMDENSKEKRQPILKEYKSEWIELMERFLFNLGLITKAKALELQNKRAERKRRSTANPQFVYSLAELPAVSVYRCCFLLRVFASTVDACQTV